MFEPAELRRELVTRTPNPELRTQNPNPELPTSNAEPNLNTNREPSTRKCERPPAASCGLPLVFPELLTDSIHEQLDAPAAAAHVDVEVLLVHEQLPELAKHTPVLAFVKLLRPHVLQRRAAARALHRI